MDHQTVVQKLRAPFSRTFYGGEGAVLIPLPPARRWLICGTWVRVSERGRAVCWGRRGTMLLAGIHHPARYRGARVEKVWNSRLWLYRSQPRDAREATKVASREARFYNPIISAIP